MHTDDPFAASLIDDIYAAALGDHGWDVVLHGLRVAMGARVATLLTYDEAAQVAAINHGVGDDDTWLMTCHRDYSREFYLYDPASPVVAGWEAGRWYRDSVMLTPKERARNVFYQEFMRPHGLGSLSGLFIHRKDGDNAFLSMVGALDAPGLSDAQCRAVSALGVHLSRALRIQSRIGQLEARTAMAESALDTAPVPVFLLGEHRKLLFANRMATDLMTAEPVLRFVHGRFAPDGIADESQWRQACTQGGVLLKRPDGSALPLALMPVPERSSLARSWHHGMTLMTAMRMGTVSARADRLRLFYGLTASEADVAVLTCCDGLSPGECADLRGVSLATVRSQIKSIHTKTGVSRSAELVGLVLAV
ncbi:helix-turn-helix transcriptional regulator [Burkholderia pyrrocinia]|uniref:helix-turn-helix transcriptional regulator n=1 Tax=Burkholderia pyrrocinia TaxID=60550 RepID=UPI002AB035C5|nr:helix-turn-helix transcriptional regulator [Burkholderia pyrrocinia]